MDLFPASEQTVVTDAHVGIRYLPELVDRDLAQRWFDALLAGANWKSERRPMYDRMVDVPRLLAAYRIDRLPDSLPFAEILVAVQAIAAAPYNTVGLNLYRNGQDSVAMHNDKLHTIVPQQPIALLSLGATRRMNVRARHGARRSISIELQSGSLLLMSHASQLTHEHGIPKTTKGVSARMSVVFRVRPNDARE